MIQSPKVNGIFFAWWRKKKGREKWGPGRVELRDSLKNGMISTDHAWGIDALSYQFKGSLSLLYSLLLLLLCKKGIPDKTLWRACNCSAATTLQATGENKIDLCTTSKERIQDIRHHTKWRIHKKKSSIIDFFYPWAFWGFSSRL